MIGDTKDDLALLVLLIILIGPYAFSPGEPIIYSTPPIGEPIMTTEPTVEPKPESVLDVLPCILAMLETGGNPNTEDNGEAVGILQMKPCIIEEVNKRCHNPQDPFYWTNEARRNPADSRRICREYLELFMTDTADRLEGWEDLHRYDLQAYSDTTQAQYLAQIFRYGPSEWRRVTDYGERAVNLYIDYQNAQRTIAEMDRVKKIMGVGE